MKYAVYIAGLLVAIGVHAEVETSEMALQQLAHEIALDAEGDKAKGRVKEKIPAMVESYLSGENEDLLYKDDGIKTENKKEGIETELRARAITDTARSFGSQAGLHWRYNEINKIINRYEGRLDSVNFRPFMTDGIILMPSVNVTRDDENYVSDKKLVKTNISFVVDVEAKIVSVPPTYRNYLIREFNTPKPVNPILRPKNKIEEAVWRTAMNEGWEMGVEEAFLIFKDGLLKLERDLQGRVNYRKMILLKMISPAALKVTKAGVTFNGRTMNVGETIYTIEDNANYRTMDEWRSAWLKSSDMAEAKNGK